MEEFTQRIKNVGKGVKIGNCMLATLLFADDVIIMAENGEDLQSLLNEVNRFGEEMGVKFSKEKSQIMIMRNEEGNQERWFIGDTELKITNEYVYLGLAVNMEGLKVEREKKMFKAEQWCGQLSSVLGFRANSYEVTRGLWKGVAIPSILYGTEVLNFRKELNNLNIIQRKMARRGLGANKWVASEALRGDMGWSSFEERVDKAILKYRIRLNFMREDRWPKKVFNWRNNKGKINKDFKKRVDENNIQINREIGARNIRLAGEEMGNNEKKCYNKIDKIIKNKGCNKWKQGMENKSTLRYFKEKVKPERVIL